MGGGFAGVVEQGCGEEAEAEEGGGGEEHGGLDDEGGGGEGGGFFGGGISSALRTESTRLRFAFGGEGRGFDGHVDFGRVEGFADGGGEDV